MARAGKNGTTGLFEELASVKIRICIISTLMYGVLSDLMDTVL